MLCREWYWQHTYPVRVFPSSLCIVETFQLSLVQPFEFTQQRLHLSTFSGTIAWRKFGACHAAFHSISVSHSWRCTERPKQRKYNNADLQICPIAFVLLVHALRVVHTCSLCDPDNLQYGETALRGFSWLVVFNYIMWSAKESCDLWKDGRSRTKLHKAKSHSRHTR